MAPRTAYRSQVELVIRCLPAIANAPNFALKGGTAINLFLRNMPRLSIDIDLTYLPISDRDTALTGMRKQLAVVNEALQRTIPGVNVQFVDSELPKLLVEKSGARIKVEPSVIFRGSLLPSVTNELCRAAQETYELFIEVQHLDIAELYGGKLCAALDRQHPRDLFDIMHLQRTGPISDSIRQAFVAYLAGHRRPITELLAPNRKPINELFANHFVGMTEEPIGLAELEAARTGLFDWAANALTEKERQFLLSVKEGEPKWTLSIRGSGPVASHSMEAA